MASLLELRKEAEKLGIENYAQYSKSELQALVEKAKETNSEVEEISAEEATDVIEVAAEEVSAEEAEEVEEKEEAGEVEEISAEEATSLDKEQKQKKSKTKKEPKEKKEPKVKKEKKVKEPKEKKPKMVYVYKYTPKGDKPEKMGEKTSIIYDELLNSNESCYKIAKKLETYFSFVDKVAQTYFNVEKNQVEG